MRTVPDSVPAESWAAAASARCRRASTTCSENCRGAPAASRPRHPPGPAQRSTASSRGRLDPRVATGSGPGARPHPGPGAGPVPGFHPGHCEGPPRPRAAALPGPRPGSAAWVSRLASNRSSSAAAGSAATTATAPATPGQWPPASAFPAGPGRSSGPGPGPAGATSAPDTAPAWPYSLSSPVASAVLSSAGACPGARLQPLPWAWTL